MFLDFNFNKSTNLPKVLWHKPIEMKIVKHFTNYLDFKLLCSIHWCVQDFFVKAAWGVLVLLDFLRQSVVSDSLKLFLLNIICAFTPLPPSTPIFISCLMFFDKLLWKEEVESQGCFSLTFPCYQHIIIHSHLPLCLQPFLPLFQQVPRPAATPCLCRWGHTADVPLTYWTKPLSSCSSTLNLLFSQSITWQLMFQHMFPGLLRFIVFHTGLRWPNRLTLTVMKLPHIERLRENNI